MKDKLSKLFFVFIIIGLIYLFFKGVNYKKEIAEHPGPVSYTHLRAHETRIGISGGGVGL